MNRNSNLESNMGLRLDKMSLKFIMTSIQYLEPGEVKSTLENVWVVAPNILKRSQHGLEAIKLIKIFSYIGVWKRKVPMQVIHKMLFVKSDDQQPEQPYIPALEVLEAHGLIGFVEPHSHPDDNDDIVHVPRNYRSVLLNESLMELICVKRDSEKMNLLRETFQMLKKSGDFYLLYDDPNCQLWNMIFDFDELVVETKQDWRDFLTDYRWRNHRRRHMEDKLFLTVLSKSVQKYSKIFGDSDLRTIELKVSELEFYCKYGKSETYLQKLTTFYPSFEEFFTTSTITVFESEREINTLGMRLLDLQYNMKAMKKSKLKLFYNEYFKIVMCIYDNSKQNKFFNLLIESFKTALKNCLKPLGRYHEIYQLLRDIREYIVENRESFFINNLYTFCFVFPFLHFNFKLDDDRNHEISEQSILEEEDIIFFVTYEYIMTNWNNLIAEVSVRTNQLEKIVRVLIEVKKRLKKFDEIMDIFKTTNTLWKNVVERLDIVNIDNETEKGYVRSIIADFISIQFEIYFLLRDNSNLKNPMLVESMKIAKECCNVFIQIGSQQHLPDSEGLTTFLDTENVAMIFVGMVYFGFEDNDSIVSFLNECESKYLEYHPENKLFLAQAILLYLNQIFKLMYKYTKEESNDLFIGLVNALFVKWKTYFKVILQLKDHSYRVCSSRSPVSATKIINDCYSMLAIHNCLDLDEDDYK